MSESEIQTGIETPEKVSCVIDDMFVSYLSHESWTSSIMVSEFMGIKRNTINSYDVDVETESVKSRKEYEETLSMIIESIPNVTFKKNVHNYGVKLSYRYIVNEKEYNLEINIPCYAGLKVMSEIAGCKLVETKHSYTNVSCKVK